MTTTEETIMTDHTEMQIPDDIARAATKAYDAPLNDDGASLVGIVNRMAEDYVKLAIARAILAERERCARIAEAEWVWPNTAAAIRGSVDK